MRNWGICHLSFFFFNDTATTEIYTLSLHDALPIYGQFRKQPPSLRHQRDAEIDDLLRSESTRLNSSHVEISYAVFCLKKKKREKNDQDNSETETIRLGGCLVCEFM